MENIVPGKENMCKSTKVTKNVCSKKNEMYLAAYMKKECPTKLSKYCKI